MALASRTVDRISRQRVDKFAERRAELAAAAIQTLSELGYARTSLREIAQNSEFSHGVLHYYFTDKVDLITCCVRQYKERCVTRYDQVTTQAASFEALVDGFVQALGATMRDEAHLHRLWYDLRSQALFEPAFRPDVAAIDDSLEQMVWRVFARLYELAGKPCHTAPALIYAVIDGVFQQGLLRHLSGQTEAIADMQTHVRDLIRTMFAPVPTHPR
jgi:AcrR family transcriptional regulator